MFRVSTNFQTFKVFVKTFVSPRSVQKSILAAMSWDPICVQPHFLCLFTWNVKCIPRDIKLDAHCILIFLDWIKHSTDGTKVVDSNALGNAIHQCLLSLFQLYHQFCFLLFLLFRNVDCLDLLISRGADFDVQDKEGRTPLHYSAGNANHQCLLSLVAMGSKVNTSDSRNCTPLHYAAAADMEAE